MERPLTNFIRALRSSDVRVSTGEALDAAHTLKLIGYADRGMLKDSLACVLAKSPEEKVTFDELFELYFSRQETASRSEATTGVTPIHRSKWACSKVARTVSSRCAKRK